MSNSDDNASAGTNGNPSSDKRWVTVRYVFNFATRLVRGLVIPKLLGPKLYGLYTSLGLAERYAKFADVSIDEYMKKHLPAELESGDEKGFQETFGRGLWWSTGLTGFYCIIIMLVGLFQQWENAWFYRVALPIVALGVIATQIGKIYNAAALAREEYGVLSKASMLSQLGGVALSLGLLFLFGVFGLVVGMTTYGIINVALLARVVDWPGFERVPLAKIKPIFFAAASLALLSGVETLMSTIDQLFILGYFPKTDYGFYSFGQFTSGVALMVCGSFTTIMHPRLMRRAEAGEHARAYQVLNYGILGFWSLLCVAFPVGYLLVYLVVHFYLPDYTPGIPLYFVIASTAFVRGPLIMMQPYFIARDEENVLIKSYLFSIGFAAALDMIIIYSGGGLLEIILATIAAYGLLNLQMLWMIDAPSTEGDRGKWMFLGLGVVIAAGFTASVSYSNGWIPGLAPLSEMLAMTGVAFVMSGICACFVWRPLKESIKYFWI